MLKRDISTLNILVASAGGMIGNVTELPVYNS